MPVNRIVVCIKLGLPVFIRPSGPGFFIKMVANTISFVLFLIRPSGIGSRTPTWAPSNSSHRCDGKGAAVVVDKDLGD